jgi:hypothetical protein
MFKQKIKRAEGQQVEFRKKKQSKLNSLSKNNMTNGIKNVRGI